MLTLCVGGRRRSPVRTPLSERQPKPRTSLHRTGACVRALRSRHRPLQRPDYRAAREDHAPRPGAGRHLGGIRHGLHCRCEPQPDHHAARGVSGAGQGADRGAPPGWRRALISGPRPTRQLRGWCRRCCGISRPGRSTRDAGDHPRGWARVESGSLLCSGQAALSCVAPFKTADARRDGERQHDQDCGDSEGHPHANRNGLRASRRHVYRA